MEEYRKNVNIQIGKRLKEARENLGHRQKLQYLLGYQMSITENMNLVQPDCLQTSC